MDARGTRDTGPDLATHDAAGVDLTLVREWLAMSPVERLRRLEEFVSSVKELRALNGNLQIR